MPKTVPGKDIVALSCEQVDVKAAFDQAAAGDRVHLPPGTAIWTEPLYWIAPPDVTVLGAGAFAEYGCADTTVIIDGPARAGNDVGLLEITTNPEGSFQMSGVTIESSGESSYNGVLRIWGACKKLRLHHNHFSGLSYVTVSFGADLEGVVDHNKVDCPSGSMVFTRFYGNGYGDESWATPAQLGSEYFLFIEDNEINSPGFGAVNDSYQGSRFVLRYNKILNSGCQTHPTGGSGRSRGTRCFEIYKNVFSSSRTNFNLCFVSSGSGVIWGNEAPTGYTHFLTLHSMRFDTKTYTQTPVPMGWGQYPSIYDDPGSAMDQPGHGAGDLFSGTFPNVKNEATGGISPDPKVNPRQTIEGVYEWDNVWTTAGGGYKCLVYEPSILQEGRDYFLDTPKPGYTPYIYPHPLTIDETVIVPNMGPLIHRLQLRGGSNQNGEILDPLLPITEKQVFIEFDISDDTGVTWYELEIKGRCIYSGFPYGDSKEIQNLAVVWNTIPYTGKGSIPLKLTIYDADGLTATQILTVTVAVATTP